MAEPTVVTSRYGTIITAIGKAKITAAILAGKQVKITHAAVGDGGGSYYKPTEEQTGLINECWRGEIASAVINETTPNMIDVKFIVPADVGGFTIREAALFDEEGDAIAIWNTPDAQKVAVTDGVSFPLTMVGHILVENAGAVSFTVNSALDTVSREEMEAALQAYGASVGSCLIKEDFTIPTEGWYLHELEGPDYDGVPYAIDIKVEKCTEKHFPSLALYRPYWLPADEAGLSPVQETYDGFIRFFAESVPESALIGTLTLRSESLVDFKLATDEDIDNTVDGVFGEGSSVVPDGYTVATDEDINTEIVEGVFGQ